MVQNPKNKILPANAKVKTGKHPEYYKNAKIICACGNVIEAGSTEPEMRVEICSACHPMYSGKHKFIDTARRVDKFEERMKKAKELQAAKKKKTKIKK